MKDANDRSLLDRAAGVVGWRLRRLQSKVSGGALARERRVVRHGIRHYQDSLGGNGDLYLLRRNVHMIEKGLTMRPRRNQFATEYIESTIDAIERVVETSSSASTSTEFHWMQSVLAEYFEATTTAEAPVIRSSGERFAAVVARVGERRDNGPKPVSSPLETVDIDALSDLAERRRSVRWYRNEPVPRDLIDTALRMGAESPTACNRQPYRFEVFDDRDSVQRVAAIPGGTRGFGAQIPGMIVVIGDMSAFFDERDRHLIYVDGALASMGVIYGLEAQGVASCCINWPDVPEREAQMRQLLGLAPYERVVMLIAYGYADPEGLAPASAKRDLGLVRTYRKV